MYHLEPKILICIDLHLPFYLYDIAFSKHLRTYSSNMPVLCLSNPFMHSSLCIQTKISLALIFLGNQYMQKHLHFHLLSVLSMPCKLDYALKTPKVEGHMQLPSNLRQTF